MFYGNSHCHSFRTNASRGLSAIAEFPIYTVAARSRIAEYTEQQRLVTAVACHTEAVHRGGLLRVRSCYALLVNSWWRFMCKTFLSCVKRGQDSQVQPSGRRLYRLA